MGNGALNMALKFFPQKSPYRLNESQKTSFGDIFPPPLSVVLLSRLFPKTTGHPCVDPHLPCELPPFEAEGLRIVVSLFRNIAKKKKYSFYTIYSNMIMEYSGSGMILKISILY